MDSALKRHTRLWVSLSPRVTFNVEDKPVSVIRTEGMDLLAQHWEEVAIQRDEQILDPDWPAYEALERLGRLWVLTARDQGRLVGYIVMLLTNAMHYRTLSMATDDSHFLHPDYRRGLTGYRMLMMTEKAMAARGIRKCVLRTKFLLDHGKLFERLGFVKEDIVYSKILGS
jgi:hypothetical protein